MTNGKMITSSMTKDLTTMKNLLVKTEQKDFTRKDFIENTYSSNYYFKQMVDIGLIIDTGKVYINRPGNPIIYTLSPLIMNPAEQKQYKLTNDDVSVLIQSKNRKLSTLNDSIKVMQNQILNLKKEKSALNVLKNANN